MRRFHRGSIIALVAAAIAGVLAVAGAHPSSAARARTTSTFDKTYSCKVRKQHYFTLWAGTTLPAANGQPEAPGALVLTTVDKSVTKKGVTTSITQMSLQDQKNSLRIDKADCKPVSKSIALSPKGLPKPPESATPSYRGHVNVRCHTTTGHVLVRLHLSLSSGTPTLAALAIRNADKKKKPVVFAHWSPKKVTAYLGGACTDLN
jgi:hypothetical protein